MALDSRRQKQQNLKDFQNDIRSNIKLNADLTKASLDNQRADIKARADLTKAALDTQRADAKLELDRDREEREGGTQSSSRIGESEEYGAKARPCRWARRPGDQGLWSKGTSNEGRTDHRAPGSVLAPEETGKSEAS